MTADPVGDFVNVFGSYVGFDGESWFVGARIDGREQVISRHADRQAAEAASAELNDSANPRVAG